MSSLAGTKALHQCLFVCKDWNACASRVIWRHIRLASSKNAIHFLTRVTEVTPRFNVKSNCTWYLKGDRWIKRGTEEELSPAEISPWLPRAVRSLAFEKLKCLDDAGMAVASHRLPNLRSLEFYICENVGEGTVSGFALTCPNLTDIRLPGCSRVGDGAILSVAAHCPLLQHLDLRACSRVTDRAIVEIAHRCRQLTHINVGRIDGGHRITDHSVRRLAELTKVSTVGLAGCSITDDGIKVLAVCRAAGIERVSVNSCAGITERALDALATHCPRLAVLEVKECLNLVKMVATEKLLARNVLVEMCTALLLRLKAYRMEITHMNAEASSAARTAAPHEHGVAE